MRSAIIFGWIMLLCTTACQESPQKRVVKESPTETTILPDSLEFDEARKRHESGDLIGALAAYNELLAQNPGNVAALGNRAILLEGKGELDAALKDYDQLISLDPENVPALVHRAALLARTGDQEAAISDFNKLLLLRPEDPLIINDRGYAYFSMASYDKALVDFEHALALAPQLSPARINRGNTLYVTDRFEEAREEFASVLEREPSNNDALLAMGKYWLFQQNLPDSAGVCFQKVLSGPAGENPTARAEAHLGMGNLKFLRRSYPDAIVEFTKGLQLVPDHLELNMNRGLARYNLNRYEEAIADYDRVLEIQPGFSSALAMRGYAKCEFGMTSSGCIDLQSAMKRGENGVKEAIVKYCR